MTDEKPPTHEESPATPPPTEEPPPAATPPAAEPPSPPESHEEKIPAWGQDLSNKVEGILDALKPPMPPDGKPVGDENPVKPPWKDRSLKSFFGFE